MKTNILKIFVVILLLIVFSLICSNTVLAGEASVSANNCNVGDSFTVTVNIPQDVSGYDIGGVTVTYSDGTTQSSKRAVKANMDLSWPGNYSTTFSGKVAGNASISVNGVILTNSSGAIVNSNQTLTTSVAIAGTTSAPSPEPNPGSSSNPNSGSSSGSGSNPSSGSDSSSGSSSGSGSSNPSNPAPVTVNFSNISEKMYTNRRVNVRQNCGTEYGIIQTLAVGTEVTRTGVGDKNKNGYSWSRISYNGVTGYVITASLTYDNPNPEEQPEEQPEEDIQDPENPEEVDNENPEEILENDEEKIKAISEELGTIPEVGVNIIPFMFIGSMASCMVIMFEVKRNIAK